MGTNKVQLTDPEIFPDDNVLESALGTGFKFYQNLLKIIDESGMSIEWRYYKDGKAWLGKVQKKKKTIVWLSAWSGYVQAAIYVPLAKIDGVYNSGINQKTQEEIKNSDNVGKSKPCVFKLKNAQKLSQLEIVMKYKQTI